MGGYYFITKKTNYVLSSTHMSKHVKFNSTKTVGGDSRERYTHIETYILSKIIYSKLKSAEFFLNSSI